MSFEASFLPIVVATYDDNYNVTALEFDWNDSFNHDDDDTPAWADTDRICAGFDDLIFKGVFNVKLLPSPTNQWNGSRCFVMANERLGIEVDLWSCDCPECVELQADAERFLS